MTARAARMTNGVCRARRGRRLVDPQRGRRQGTEALMVWRALARRRRAVRFDSRGVGEERVREHAAAWMRRRRRAGRRRRRRRRLRGEGGADKKRADLRHFCAYHAVALEASKREHERARVRRDLPVRRQVHARALRGRREAARFRGPEYVDLTPRRLGPPRRHDAGAAAPAARLGRGEVRAVAAAMSCCGDVASASRGRRPPQRGLRVHGTAKTRAPPWRYSPRVATLSLNGVLPNTASGARAARSC